MKPPGISVVVVSYNTKEQLRRCLSCIEADHEVIVVDNASTDGSPQMVHAEFPHVRLVANPSNLGFGAANNLGAGLASGNWILYLNSDAYARPGAIAKLATDAGTAVAAGGRLLNVDRSLQQSVAGPLTLWHVFLEQSMLEKVFKTFWRTPLGDQVCEVEQVMGACMMVRAGLEAFDERYFLYCEDTDLCLRLKRHGQIFYCPGAEFVHELGASSSPNQWLGIARYNRGKEIYFRIHHSVVASKLCWLLNRSGAMLRLVVWTLVKPLGHQPKTWWNVLTAKSSKLDPRQV